MRNENIKKKAMLEDAFVKLKAYKGTTYKQGYTHKQNKGEKNVALCIHI